MAIRITDDTHYKNIAAAIRKKTGGEGILKPADMAPALNAATLNELIVTPSTEVQTFEAESPCIGFKKVTVEAAEYSEGEGGGEIVEPEEPLEAAEDTTFGIEDSTKLSVYGEMTLPSAPTLAPEYYPYQLLFSSCTSENVLCDDGVMRTRLSYDFYFAGSNHEMIIDYQGYMYWYENTISEYDEEVRGYWHSNGNGYVLYKLTTIKTDPISGDLIVEGNENWTEIGRVDTTAEPVLTNGGAIYNGYVELVSKGGNAANWCNYQLRLRRSSGSFEDYEITPSEPVAAGVARLYAERADSYEVQGDTMNELIGGIQDLADSEHPMSPEDASDFINSYVPLEIQPEATVTPGLTVQMVVPESGYDGIAKVIVEATPLENTTVTPTAAEQVLTPPVGILGFKRVMVEGIPLQEKTAWPTAWTDVVVEADDEYAGLKKVTVKPAALEEATVTPTTEEQVLVPSDGYLGFSQVTVCGVEEGATMLQEKSVIPSTSEQVVTPDDGFDALTKVLVGATPLEEKAVSPAVEEQVLTPSGGNIGFSKVTVEAAKLQDVTITPQNVEQTISPSDGYYGIGNITVKAAESGGGGAADLIDGTVTELVDGEAQSVRDYALYQVKTLVTVSLPAASSIGSYAFAGCTSLASANFQSATNIGIYAFSGCTKMANVSFPAALNISDYAFYGCASLTAANFPNATAIGSSAFQGCTSLAAVSFPTALSVYYQAFRGCTTLNEASFPEVTGCGVGVFSGCNALTTVDMPKLPTINNSMFVGCANLTTVNIPEATAVGISAFYSCGKLSEVEFPVASVVYSSAFGWCSSLSKANFPSAKNIGPFAFANCSSLSEINFPVATTINSSAFANCKSLTSVNFPNVLTIQSRAFAQCDNLASANFPVATGIKGSYTFYMCYNLSTVVLGGSSVCTLSTSLAFSSTPFAGYSKSFSGTPIIYVPSSLVASYQTASNWTYFKSFFSAIEDMPTG